jgi:hypothetical protein
MVAWLTPARRAASVIDSVMISAGRWLTNSASLCSEGRRPGRNFSIRDNIGGLPLPDDRCHELRQRSSMEKNYTRSG